jgi:hypothetical protein
MAAIPEAHRQDADPVSSARPFAAPDAGADYFATDGHYLSLARRIVAGLQRRPSFVVVTADPPPGPGQLVPALIEAVAGLYAVGVIVCGPELKREHLLRAVPPSGTPLLVFDEAEKLTDGQLGGLCDALVGRDGNAPAAVLLARPSCLARLQSLQPRLFRDGLASHFRLHELGPEEIEIFVRRQLRPGEKPAALTAEAITAIADFSGGDLSTVNRLTRLITEFADLAGSKAATKPADGAAEPAALQREIGSGTSSGIGDHAMRAMTEFSVDEPPLATVAGNLPHPLPQRRGASRLRFGILLFFCIAGLTTVPGDAVSSSGHRLIQHMAVFDLPKVSSWITPLGAHVFARLFGNAPRAVDGEFQAEKEVRPPGSTSAAPLSMIPTEETAPGSAPMQPSAPAATAQPLPPPAEPSAVAPSVGPSPPAAEAVALVARGDEFVVARDIASARLFYERAAEMGDGRAALRMAATFDPGFLERAGIRGAEGDQQQALSWYSRANNLGNGQVERLFKSFDPAQ